MNPSYFSLRQLSAALLMLLLIVTPGWAQDEDDTLLHEDDDILIFRSEDGTLKIKRTDADDDDWLAIISDGGVYRFRVDGGPDGPLRNRVTALRWRADDDDFDHNFDFEFPSVVHFDGWRDHLAGELSAFDGFGERTKMRSEIIHMDTEAQRLARRVRVAEGTERERLEAELDTLLGDIFERKQDIQAERLEALEEEADEIRDRYSERQQRRDEIIDRRKRELLGERNVLDW